MCLLTAGENVTVTGLGSALNPYVISATGATETTPPQGRFPYEGGLSVPGPPGGWYGITLDATGYVENASFYDSGNLTIPTGAAGWYSVVVNLTWYMDAAFPGDGSGLVFAKLRLDPVGSDPSYAVASQVIPAYSSGDWTSIGTFNFSWQGALAEGDTLSIAAKNEITSAMMIIDSDTSYGGSYVSIHRDSAAYVPIV